MLFCSRVVKLSFLVMILRFIAALHRRQVVKALLLRCKDDSYEKASLDK